MIFIIYIESLKKLAKYDKISHHFLFYLNIVYYLCKCNQRRVVKQAKQDSLECNKYKICR